MRRLQRSMIFTVFLSLLLVFTTILVTVNLTLSLYNKRQAADMTSLIQSNDGSVPTRTDFELNFSGEDYAQGLDVTDETAFRTRYFTVTVDANGKVIKTSLDHIAGVDESEAQNLTDSLNGASHNTGYTGNYFYRITRGESSTKEIIFLDCSEAQASQRLAVHTVCFAASILIVIVTSVFALLSSRIMRPFEENEKRQKRFITDASHELKTPLAIIAANADVLKMKEGENTWLNNITDQTSRMSSLINDMLSLTKANEIGEGFAKEPVDLVPLLNSLCTTFAESLTARDVALVKNLPEHLTINGSAEMLQRLFSVLLENASKYTTCHGTIELTLSAGTRSVTATLYNTATLPADFNCAHLFDRFYRPDSSRASSTGGHGIGLSIAETIVQNHRGTISAAKARDGICFTVTLPKDLK